MVPGTVAEVTVGISTLARTIVTVNGAATPARLAPKPAMPSYVQYEKPPLSFDGELVGAGELRGFRVRCRVYDYGVISLALTQPYAGAWSGLVEIGRAHV